MNRDVLARVGAILATIEHIRLIAEADDDPATLLREIRAACSPYKGKSAAQILKNIEGITT